MKYAIRYRKDFRHFDDVDEVIFPVRKGDESLLTLPSIVKHQYQKITLSLEIDKPLEEIIPHILKLKEVHPNILIQIAWPFDPEDVQLMKDNDIPFMANLGFCKSLDMVYAMKQAGVAELYVVEGLGFHLDAVKKILADTDIQVRVIPNVTQCALGTRRVIPTEHKFWIRPEDTRFYEKYVDTFELYNEDDKLSAIYEIYTKRVWQGKISEIIMDAEDLEVQNDTMPPYFGDVRINCGQRCFFGSCAACEANIDFAKAMSQTEYGINYARKLATRGNANEDKTN